jgi:hypothetical protein
MAAGSRDHLQPNQFNHFQHFQFQLFPHSLSLHTRFDGPTDETPNLTTKRSLLHRARRSVLSFSSPSPQASKSLYASKRPRQEELYQDRPDVKRTMPSSLAYSGATRTINETRSLGLNGTRVESSMDEGRPKNEDVFLNIARADSGRRDSVGRSDFRRVSENNIGLGPIAFLIAPSMTSRLTPSRDSPIANENICTSHGLVILVRVYGRQRQNRPSHPISDTAISTTPCISRMIPPLPPTAPSTLQRHRPILWTTRVASATVALDLVRDPLSAFREADLAVRAQKPHRAHLLRPRRKSVDPL